MEIRKPKISKQAIVLFVVFAITLAFAAHNFRNMAIVNSTLDSSPIGATTPSTATITALTVNTNIVNSAAFQRFRSSGTSCTTGSSNGNSCTTGSITLPVPEPDTSYTVICSLDGSNTGSPVFQGVGSRTTTTVTLGITNAGNVAASYGTADCLVFHD